MVKKKKKKKSKLMNIFVIGKKGGLRKVRVKSKKNYNPISKIGRSFVYQKEIREEKKRIKRKKRQKDKTLKAKTSRERTIEKIREVIGADGKAPKKKIQMPLRQLESNLLMNPSLESSTARRFLQKKINPQGKVMSNGKIYKSFSELEKDKYNIYRNIILKNLNNEKLVQKIYANRNLILRDGLVTNIKMFGTVNRRIKNKLFFLGEIEVVGLLMEEIGKVKEAITGFSGYVRDLGNKINSIAGYHKGGSAKLISNNSEGTNVQITSVEVSFSYA